MISIQGVSKRYGSKILFTDASARISSRSKCALIGANGAGKSTLIRMILGQEEPDTGTLARAQGLSIGHLAQEVPKFSGMSVLGETMRLDGRREKLLELKSDLECALERDPSESETLDRLGRVLEELEGLDEYRLESKAQAILMGMGFKQSDFSRPLTEFSGGWLMRVALSRILLLEPDLLLLDEPTNHLDLESLLWLEEFLRAFKGAMLLVSHDRAFLNRLVGEVLELEGGKLTSYSGNLDAQKAQKEERLLVLRAAAKAQEQKRADLQDFIDRFGAKATKASQAQSRAKQLEKLEAEWIELPEERAKVRFRFPPCPPSGREVITFKNASFAYGEKILFKGLSPILQRGARMAITGVNGAGKTTLLRLLSGSLRPTGGDLFLGHGVKIGYYAQIQAESLDLSKTVLEELETVAPTLPTSQIRGIAGAFLFSGDAVEKKCGVLSGGEKARVALAKLLLSPANFLILDEPTNHLDADSREVLRQALSTFEGTLCLVSHDREFIGPLVTTVWEIIPSGSGSDVVPLIGSYDDYLARKVSEARERTAPESRESKLTTTATARTPKSGISNNQRQAWKREFTAIETKITRLEGQRSELASALTDPTVYDDKSKLLELSDRLRAVEAELSTSLSRWEELAHLV